MEGRKNGVCRKKNKHTLTSPSHSHSFPAENHRKSTFISCSDSLCSPLPESPSKSPDLSTCHSCGIRDDRLQTLDSQWRIVLLCHGCLSRIRSAAVCSYCFNSGDADVLVCRTCFCRVHLRCIPVQRRYITLSEFNPVSFTCIDCRAIPRPQFRNLGLSRAFLESFIRVVRSAAKKKAALAARARFKALQKADDARVAMESAFDAILFARDAAVGDKNLALQLHRAMNGSQRILQRQSQANLGEFFLPKQDCGFGSSISIPKRLRKLRKRVDEKFGICRKDDGDLKSNNASLSERNSFVKPCCVVEKEISENDADNANGSAEVILNMDNGRYFDFVMNYDKGIGNDGLALVSCRESADSNSLMEASECGIGAAEDYSNRQDDKKYIVPANCSIAKQYMESHRLKKK